MRTNYVPVSANLGKAANTNTNCPNGGLPKNITLKVNAFPATMEKNEEGSDKETALHEDTDDDDDLAGKAQPTGPAYVFDQVKSRMALAGIYSTHATPTSEEQYNEDD